MRGFFLLYFNFFPFGPLTVNPTFFLHLLGATVACAAAVEEASK